MTNLFEIEASQIEQLTDFQLTELLNKLLWLEALEFGIALRSVDVALNITVADDGEDGRIEWQGHPTSTDFLPSQLVMFQNKATKDSGPSKYGNEIVTKEGKIKKAVDEILSAKGVYCVFTTKLLNGKQKRERIKAIREKLKELGLQYHNTAHIEIYDATQIAIWVNRYSGTIQTVQQYHGTQTIPGVKTIDQWGEHRELSKLPFADVSSRSDVIETISSKLEKDGNCIRLVGLSGLGKTWTAFQLVNENNNIRNAAVYIDAAHIPNVSAHFADWVNQKIRAVVIVDNCDYQTHAKIAQEVTRPACKISVLTLDYNFELTSNVNYIRLEQMTDDEVIQLLKPEYGDNLPDLDRIAKYAQGFPLMAVLLAEARIGNENNIGELTDDQIAQNLLWGRDNLVNNNYLKIMQGCSLFDTFGIDGKVDYQLDFIANLISISKDEAYSCIQHFIERGIVDRRGRLGQVIPKPLAIRLAGQWWRQSNSERHKELVSTIPDSMIKSFCTQVEKLDFHPDVKSLSEELCGPTGPFGQAEVILSVRGSILFRSFAIVNPQSTSTALHETLTKLSHEQLLEIEGDTRRNLVFTLEKLCFNSSVFSISAWCLLLLAKAENEHWSNNSTGIFIQLFRIYLSGTEAPPEKRILVLKNALTLQETAVDLIAIDALSKALRIHSGNRMAGSEVQGSKEPLKEWQPDVWADIFEYIEKVFALLLQLHDRGEEQRNRVMTVIGNSIREMVSIGRLELLDTAIEKIVSDNGKFWPEAIDSIASSIEHDADEYPDEAKRSLERWADILSPKEAELTDKIKMLIVCPVRNHSIDENGNFIDPTLENTNNFAEELVNNLDEFLPHLPLILEGEQSQAYQLGYAMASHLDDVSILLAKALESIKEIKYSNVAYINGILRHVYEYRKNEWSHYIDSVANSPDLVKHFPIFLTTGKLRTSHLDQLVSLIENASITPESLQSLSYGSFTNSIESKPFLDFCLQLSKLGRKEAWIAVKILYMYTRDDSNDFYEFREIAENVVINTELTKDKSNERFAFAYEWEKLIELLLNDPNPEFINLLVLRILEDCKSGMDLNFSSNYAKPIFRKLISEHHKIVWQQTAHAISSSGGMELYWLKRLFERERGWTNPQPSLFSAIPVSEVVSWCKENPDIGPWFVADTLNIFTEKDDVKKPTELFLAVLESFGFEERVRKELHANLATRFWSGSLVPSLESDKLALEPLQSHQNENIRLWVTEYMTYVEKEIERHLISDEEEDFGFY